MTIRTIWATGHSRALTLARNAAAAGILAALLAAATIPALPVAAGGCGATPDGAGASDQDGDGLTCYEEFSIYGTDPLVYDTDGDTDGDGWEVANGKNPFVPDHAYLGDGMGAGSAHGTDPLDSDGDGLSDDAEYNVYGTGRYTNDTDGDGWLDGEEVYRGTNPLVPASAVGPYGDTDGDGIADIAERDLYGTDPTRYDTDGDGASDGYEVFTCCGEPLVPNPWGP